MAHVVAVAVAVAIDGEGGQLIVLQQVALAHAQESLHEQTHHARTVGTGHTVDIDCLAAPQVGEHRPEHLAVQAVLFEVAAVVGLDVIVGDILSQRGEVDIVAVQVIVVAQLMVEAEVYLGTYAQVIVHQAYVLLAGLNHYAVSVLVAVSLEGELPASVYLAILEGVSVGGLLSAEVTHIVHAGGIDHAPPARGAELTLGDYLVAVCHAVGIRAVRCQVPDEVARSVPVDVAVDHGTPLWLQLLHCHVQTVCRLAAFPTHLYGPRLVQSVRRLLAILLDERVAVVIVGIGHLVVECLHLRVLQVVLLRLGLGLRRSEHDGGESHHQR